MFAGNRGIALTIITVVIICITALVAIFYSFFLTVQDIEFGNVKALEPDRALEVLGRQTNYNFAIPEASDIAGTATEQKTDQEESQKPTPTESKNKPIYNFNFEIPEQPAPPDILSIQIPNIQYNSPVITSDDGDSAIDYGAWFYPESNHPRKGEAIFLCHRRYFKSYDPKSCWNLDKVSKGSLLYITYKDGSQDMYKVEAISVNEGDDLSIYNTTDEKRIKLISCAKENGQIGSSSHRIVLVAEKI